MKRAIYQGIQSIEFQEVEIPKCGDHDVLIKNVYAAICGSDVSSYFHGGDQNRIFKGFEFGHEMVSEIVEVGKDVTDFKVGQYVYPYPLFAKNDMSRAATVGGFSEYVLIPNAKLNHSLYIVDETKIPLKVASLIEPCTVGTKAARRSRPQKGENAIVFGAGAIGYSAAMALKHFGCEKVMIVDLSDFRLENAAKQGFYTCNSAKEDLKAKAMEVFGQAPSLMGMTCNVDIFIDAVGHESVFRQFQGMAKLYARLVIVGVHHKSVEVNFMPITYSQYEIIGSGGYSPEDVKDVMTMMETKEFDYEMLITDEYKLDDLNEAIIKASKADEALKVIINYVD